MEITYNESLKLGDSIRDAFQDAVAKIDFYIQQVFEEEGGEKIVFNPLLDDNGDGIGHRDVPDGGDGNNEGLADLTKFIE